ncbi:hypothetical protein DENSPDRAFT_813716 [Dentipellis sp. KUC8613]|nr:hypothetical protein DENSPDRAFT_813716 [Dentipellis sp. KUC8613]
MEGWEDRLHISFLGEHVLFTGLRLESFGSFLAAALLTIGICFTERLLTLALTRRWAPFRSLHRSRLRSALWRTALYWVVTFLRLLYMLISMTFHIGCCSSPLGSQVSALSVGQFAMEYLDQPQQSHSPRDRDSYRLHEPLLSPMSPSPLGDKPRSPPYTRPRAKSKSKPASLFIHPNQSNLSRADAAAVELGLHGSTERVKATGKYGDDEDVAWEHGKGRDVARELLRGKSARADEQQKLFNIGDGESEDGEF